MAIPLNINGTDYFYPVTGDTGWGPDATDWAVAVTQGMLQKAGGLFTLLNEVDFGPTHGLKSAYYKSRSNDVASSGSLRLARTDAVAWRNAANDGDLLLTVDSSNNLIFDGSPIGVITSIQDTISIDLDLTGTQLSANLNLSTDAADSGYTLVDLDFSTNGLRAQIANSGIIAALPQALGPSASPTFSGLTISSFTGGVLKSDGLGVISASSIFNSDISTTAGIEFTKLQSLPQAQILVGDTFNQAVARSMTGDVGINGTGVTAIQAGVITNSMINSAAAIALSKLANIGSNRILGNDTGGSGPIKELTGAEATALLVPFVGDTGSGGVKGLVPAPTAGDETRYLKGDGTWATPSSSGGSAGFFGGGTDGDVTISTPTVLTRDMFYNNLTISGSGSIDPSGFRIFVAGVLDLTGASANAIQRNGNNGNSSTTQTGGTGGAFVVTNGSATICGTNNVAGGNGGNANTGSGSSNGGNGGGTGNQGRGGPGGGKNLTVNAGQGGSSPSSSGSLGGDSGALQLETPIGYFTTILERTGSMFLGGSGGAGGGPGAGDNTNSGAGGGGGGSPGSIIFIVAKSVRSSGAAAGAISSKGGNGGNGATRVTGNVGGGGGGSGAGGGFVYFVYGDKLDSAATDLIDVSGGNSGAGGDAINSGVSGGYSGAGGAGGRITLLNLTTGQCNLYYGGTTTAPNAPSGKIGGASVSGESLKASF